MIGPKYTFHQIDGRKTNEYVDRDPFNIYAKKNPNTIGFQDDVKQFSSQEKREFIASLDRLHHTLPCHNTCPWMLWYHPWEDAIYIQHGFNIEHVHKLHWWRKKWPYESALDLSNIVASIRIWIERVHEHLDKVHDDTRSIDWFDFLTPPTPANVDMGRESEYSVESRFTNEGSMY